MFSDSLIAYNTKLIQPFWKTVGTVPRMLKVEQPYDPEIALLGICPKDIDAVKIRGTSTPGFMAVISTIVRLWKEQRCPYIFF